MPYKDEQKRKEYNRNYHRDYRKKQTMLLHEAKRQLGIPIDKRLKKAKVKA